MSLSIRTVAMRDGMMMRGNHHMPPSRRHWRCDQSAFSLVDPHGTPLLWWEPGYIVGDISLTVAKPHMDRGNGLPVIPNPNETLLYFELVRVGGLPMIRTWWAVGPNIDRTMRKARLELFDKRSWPGRVGELLKLMDWVY